MFQLFSDPEKVTAICIVALFALCIIAPFVGIYERNHNHKRDEHEYRDRQRELMKWENELKRRESRLDK